MPERSSHWSQLVALDAPMVKQFYLGFGAVGDTRRTSLIPTLFNVQGSNTATEKSFGVGTLGSDGWAEFEETGHVNYDEVHKGWEKTYTHTEFAKGVKVQRKLIDDNQTRIAFGRANALGDSAWRKREKDGAGVFNNAFTDTGPDSQSLCDTDHPRNAEDSTTYSNEGSTALSKTAVSDTRKLMQAYEDDSGDLMDVMPDAILIPPELEDTAIEITKSVLDPTSANNAVNPQAGRFRTIVWHYLTDATNWFMLDSGRQRQFLNWFDRIPIEFAAESDQVDTLTRSYRAYMRYSFGYDDPKFIYGHLVAG